MTFSTMSPYFHRNRRPFILHSTTDMSYQIPQGLRRAKTAALVALLGSVFLFINQSGLAASFSDTLAQGINPAYWALRANTALFSVNTNGGNVFFSKTAGSSSNYQFMALASLLAARGNFDVQVGFTNASITLVSGTRGNQIQLNTRFGGQDFLMVRSDEVGLGENAHVWVNPGKKVEGAIAWTTNFGTLRVVRTGTLLQGYIDTTMIYQTDYNTNDATFSFVLQNDHTSDAVSVGFCNFQLTADEIVPLSEQLTTQVAGPGALVVSWRDHSWPDFLQGYTLLSSTNLAGSYFWQPDPNPLTLSANQWSTTFSMTNTAKFFQFMQGP